MNIRDQIKDAIKAKLEQEVAELDMSDIYEAVAESIIDDEIGNVEIATQEYIQVYAGDWSGHYGAADILRDILESNL